MACPRDGKEALSISFFSSPIAIGKWRKERGNRFEVLLFPFIFYFFSSAINSWSTKRRLKERLISSWRIKKRNKENERRDVTSRIWSLFFLSIMCARAVAQSSIGAHMKEKRMIAGSIFFLFQPSANGHRLLTSWKLWPLLAGWNEKKMENELFDRLSLRLSLFFSLMCLRKGKEKRKQTLKRERGQERR